MWCFLIRWCCGVGVSSILAFRPEALRTLRYFPNDTELALGMTLLEFTGSYKFSVSVKKMGEGWTGGASDIVKEKSSGEDPRATGGLVSNFLHPRVNKTKQHTEVGFFFWPLDLQELQTAHRRALTVLYVVVPLIHRPACSSHACTLHVLACVWSHFCKGCCFASLSSTPWVSLVSKACGPADTQEHGYPPCPAPPAGIIQHFWLTRQSESTQKWGTTLGAGYVQSLQRCCLVAGGGAARAESEPEDPERWRATPRKEVLVHWRAERLGKMARRMRPACEGTAAEG